jgi:hypothetical protein
MVIRLREQLAEPLEREMIDEVVARSPALTERGERGRRTPASGRVGGWRASQVHRRGFVVAGPGSPHGWW